MSNFSIELEDQINATLNLGSTLKNLANEKFSKNNVDLAYELHYNKQILMKVLAHIIAEIAYFDGEANNIKVTKETTSEMAEEFVNRLNVHTAKVHFTQNELNDISTIIEESKKFI